MIKRHIIRLSPLEYLAALAGTVAVDELFNFGIRIGLIGILIFALAHLAVWLLIPAVKKVIYGED